MIVFYSIFFTVARVPLIRQSKAGYKHMVNQISLPLFVVAFNLNQIILKELVNNVLIILLSYLIAVSFILPVCLTRKKMFKYRYLIMGTTKRFWLYAIYLTVFLVNAVIMIVNNLPSKIDRKSVV